MMLEKLPKKEMQTALNCVRLLAYSGVLPEASIRARLGRSKEELGALADMLGDPSRLKMFSDEHGVLSNCVYEVHFLLPERASLLSDFEIESRRSVLAVLESLKAIRIASSAASDYDIYRDADWLDPKIIDRNSFTDFVFKAILNADITCSALEGWRTAYFDPFSGIVLMTSQGDEFSFTMFPAPSTYVRAQYVPGSELVPSEADELMLTECIDFLKRHGVPFGDSDPEAALQCLRVLEEPADDNDLQKATEKLRIAAAGAESCLRSFLSFDEGKGNKRGPGDGLPDGEKVKRALAMWERLGTAAAIVCGLDDWVRIRLCGKSAARIENISLVATVIANPSYVRAGLVSGRTAFWDRSTRRCVIVSHLDPNMGTAFGSSIQHFRNGYTLMGFNSLSHDDQHLVFNCMKYIFGTRLIPDRGFSTRLGFSREQLSNLIESWPALDRPGQNKILVMAINNCLNEITNGMRPNPKELKEEYGILSKDEVRKVYDRWLKLEGAVGGIQ
jgi:hypothetical protein